MMQRYLQNDHSCLNDPSYSQQEAAEFCKWLETKESAVRQEYESILKRDRARWNEYCRSAHENEKRAAPLMRTAPKGKPGAPLGSKAEDYAAQHPSKSYGQMAKEDLQDDPQSVSEAAAKKLLIKKERERIRSSVRRSRRRSTN